MRCNFIKRLWQFFLQLNLYKISSSNEQTLRKEQLATRIYICSLAFFVLIITVTCAVIGRTIDKIEYSPSYKKFSQLRHKYPNTLHCPCSKLGIKYNTFVTTRVYFHQVCSSQFIEQEWIDFVFAEYNKSSLSFDDFRLTLSFFWKIIADLCVISNRTWMDAETGFRASHTFSPVAVTDDVIKTQVQSALNNHINSVRMTLHRNLLALRRLTSANQMISALATNFYLRYPPVDSNPTGSPKMSPRIFNNCSCLNVEGCPHSSTFNDDHGHSITIPGMIVDCLIIDGTLASTFECYYDQACISLLHLSLPKDIHPLSNDSNKNFRMNSTVEMILNEIMINEMTNEIRFDLFYSQCKPTHCSYSYAYRFDVLFITTIILGIFGSLSFILEIIAPLIAARILRWRSSVAITNNNNISHGTSAQLNQLHPFLNHFRLLSNTIRLSFANLNLFESRRSRTNSNIFREQLLTRIFIVLITCFSIAAGIYTIFFVQEQVVTIVQPSLSTYEQLYNDHSNALRCPCSTASVKYGSFINVTFVLHQVCSSDLISPIWLNYLASFDPILLPSWTDTKYSRDFRSIGASYFQTLSTFCSLAKSNIEDAQRIFINTRFINDHILAPSLFMQQTQAIINSFVISTQNDFRRIFNWANIAFSSSYFLTGENTNFAIIISDDDQVIIDSVHYYSDAKITKNEISSNTPCKCREDYKDCYRIPLLYTNGSENHEFQQIFDELPAGCTPLTGFLRSKFSWWYNENYMKDIHTSYSMVIQSQFLPFIKPLNASVPTRFGYDNLEYLLQKMFMETSIENDTHFNQFYNECAPIACSYTVMQRRNWIVVLFLLFSLCSILSQVLQTVLRCMGKVIFFFIDWWQNRRTQQGISSTNIHPNHLFHIIYKSIINMNLYKTTTTDEIITQQQRIYTRVYVILLISCLSIILFHMAITERIITKTYMLSSIKEYEHLLSLHSDDLNCPCTFISIPYNNFVTELYVNEYHEICSNNIINLVFSEHPFYDPGFIFDKEDFRSTIMSYTDTIDQLCTVAQETVKNSIMIFQTSTMLVNQLLPRILFDDEINDTLQRFQKKTPIEFARTLDLIRTTIHGNALMSLYSSNWKLVVAEKGKGRNASFHSESITYVNAENNRSCSCVTSRTCTIPAKLYLSVPFILESLVIGCYLLESVLHSSLSCYYSLHCINNLRRTLFAVLVNQYSNSSLFNLVPLNASLTRFHVNDTIETLAYEMFIESWISNVSYDEFFNSCAPRSCTYKYYYRFDALEFLTTFLTVYPGLSFGIWLIVPYLVRMIKKIKNRIRIVPSQ